MTVAKWLEEMAELWCGPGSNGFREIAQRYEMLVDLAEDSLAEAKANWQNVAHHPASRFAKDVRYLQECLDKAKAPIGIEKEKT